MQFVVVAEPSDQFAAWLARQQQPAPQPTDPLLLRGQQVFLGAACVYCHIFEYQSTHNTGGAIMGSNPGTSVTNKYGQV